MRSLLTFISIILLGIGVWMVISLPPSDTGTDNTSTTTADTASDNPPTTTAWATYENNRFGYEITYPDNFSVQTDSQNNDGRVLTSDAEDVTLRVFASNNIENKSLRTFVGEETQRLISVTGAYIGSTTATIAGGVSNDRQRQVKILFTEEKVAIARLTYTNNQNENYDTMLNSFRWLSTTETNPN